MLPRPCASASPPRRPAPCTSAAPARRSTTGCSPRGRGGELVLRIEDTDRERSTPENVEQIFDALRWLEIDWDGEPVFQSQRADRHAEVVEQLLAAATPTAPPPGPDEVRAFKEAHGNRGFRGEDEGAGAVRLRVPDEGDDRRRRHPRRDGVRERAAGRPRDRARRRHAGLPPRGRGRRPRRRHHARGARRRPLLQHAQARADPAGDGRADAGLRPPAAAARARRQEALQAPRRGLRAGAARPRLPARGGPQLPRAARLGLRRRDDVLHHRGAAASASRSSASPSRRRCSTSRSCAG